MEINWGQVAVSVLLALIGSTGFWSWILAKREKNDAKAAAEALKVALRLIDKSVTSGVYARNTAARKKATLTKLVNGISK